METRATYTTNDERRAALRDANGRGLRMIHDDHATVDGPEGPVFASGLLTFTDAPEQSTTDPVRDRIAELRAKGAEHWTEQEHWEALDLVMQSR